MPPRTLTGFATAVQTKVIYNGKPTLLVRCLY